MTKPDTSKMTVQKFIDVINDNIQYPENRPLEFWIGDKLYEIKAISAYSILPTVMVELKPAND